MSWCLAFSTPPIALLEAGGASASTVPTRLISSGSIPSLLELVSGGADAPSDFLVLAAPTTRQILVLSTPTPALLCTINVTTNITNTSDQWIGVAVTAGGNVAVGTADGTATVWALSPGTGGKGCASTQIATTSSQSAGTNSTTAFSTFVAYANASSASSSSGARSTENANDNNTETSTTLLVFSAGALTATDAATTTALLLTESTANPTTTTRSNSAPQTGGTLSLSAASSSTTSPSFTDVAQAAITPLWQNRPLQGTDGLLRIAATTLFSRPTASVIPIHCASLFHTNDNVQCTNDQGELALVSAHADGAVYVHTLDGSLVASTIVALRNVTAVPVVDVLGTGRPTIVVVSRLPDSTDRRNSGGRAPPAAPLPPATTTTSLAPVVATTPPSSRAVALWLNASLELEITGPPLALDDMDGSVWASATTAAVYSDGFQGGVQQQQRQQLVGLREHSQQVSGLVFPVNVLVYGDGRVLARRRRAVEGTLGQQEFAATLNITTGQNFSAGALVGLMQSTGTNTHNFEVCSKDQYVNLLQLLQATSGLSVNQAPIRVWIELLPPTEAVEDACQPPDDSPLTPGFNESAFFGNNSSNYLDYAAWGALVGAVAAQFPHVAALNVDDMSHDISPPAGVFVPEHVVGRKVL